MGYFSSIFPIASQKSSPFPKIPPPPTLSIVTDTMLLFEYCA